MVVEVNWLKETHAGQTYWPCLETFSLKTITTSGVYVIWHGGNCPKTIRVGQGNVADRLGKHLQEEHILRYRECGTLFATWTSIPKHQRGGVEKFLADGLHPLEGCRFPNETPIQVNLPWSQPPSDL